MKDTIYDIVSLSASIKRNLRNSILQIVLYSTILVFSILFVVFYGSYLPVFICNLLIICVSLFFLSKSLNKIKFTDYKKATGMIVNVHKAVKTIDTKAVGGLNIFGFRKYDSYTKDEIRLTVFIGDKESVNGFYLKNVTEKHVKYYESYDEAIHIWGTRFPVKTNIENNQWLCPVCGEFNSEEEKVCSGCKGKILK